MRVVDFMTGCLFACAACFAQPKAFSAQEQKVNHVATETLCRAAIDIGSGSTKLCVALVDKETGRVQQILFGEEFQVLVAHNFKERNDGTLGDEILGEVEERVRIYRDLALQLGAEKVSGVATAAFRESKNGRAFINKISVELDVDLRVITQEEEGHIGFLTAVAASGKEKDEVIAWDSGSASFQIVYRGEEGLAVYKGPWGDSKVMAELVRTVQGREFTAETSANPVTLPEVKVLCEIIKQGLPPISLGLQNKMAELNGRVVSIGGGTSIFDKAVNVLGKKTFNKAEVWSVIESLVGKTDEEMAVYFPQPKFVIPELALLYSVMDHFNIETVQSCQAIGSTLGMFMDENYWHQN